MLIRLVILAAAFTLLHACNSPSSPNLQKSVAAVTTDPSPSPSPSQSPATETGHFLYVASWGQSMGSDGVYVFSIESNGTLSYVDLQGPFEGGGANYLSLGSGSHAGDLFVFVTQTLGSQSINETAEYSIEDTGDLSPVNINLGFPQAENLGATCCAIHTQATLGEFTFTIENGDVSSSAGDSYQAGSNPVTLLLK